MSAVTVYRDGPARVTLTGDLEAWARSVLDESTRASVAEAEAALEPIAKAARDAWYGPNGVRRVTGKGGDIQVVTTIDATRNVVRVSVGSVDDRKAGKSGKPVAVFQHRPGALSRTTRPATHEDFKSGKAKASPRGEHIPGRGYVEERNPRASDGAFLLPELVTKPARKIIKGTIKPVVIRRIKEAIERGGAR